MKYLGVNLDSRENGKKKQVPIRGKSSLGNINVFLAREPNIEVKVLKQ
jgi:hypothetical protein